MKIQIIYLKMISFFQRRIFVMILNEHKKQHLSNMYIHSHHINSHLKTRRVRLITSIHYFVNGGLLITRTSDNVLII